VHIDKIEEERSLLLERLNEAISSIPDYKEMRIVIDSSFVQARGIAFSDNLVRVSPKRFDSLGKDPMHMALYLMTRYNERHEHEERQRLLNVAFAKAELKEVLDVIYRTATEEEQREIVSDLRDAIRDLGGTE